MQKHTGTINKCVKSNTRNALEIIIKDLLISDSAKATLLEDLRYLGIADDNDPIVKITLVQGIFAKYIGDMVRILSSERRKFETATVGFKAIENSFSSDLFDFKNNIKIWRDESVIEAEKGLKKLRKDKLLLEENIVKEKKELDSLKKSAWTFLFSVCVIFILILGGFVMICDAYAKYQLNSKKSMEYEQVDNYHINLELRIEDGKAYAIIDEDKMVRFSDDYVGGEILNLVMTMLEAKY